MTISAKEVQELRKMSGAGMMECKSALADANGDLNTAFKLLREKGIAKAEKKSSREANEGLIGIKISNNTASIIEVNTETDFVSRNAEFHKLVRNILDISVKHEDKTKFENETKNLINEAVGIIGENIILKNFGSLDGNVFSYIHNSVADGLGKIGVLIKIESDKEIDKEIGKNLAMHIAAASPKAISKDLLDSNLVEEEKEIIKQQLRESGKPENILEKMMIGKLNKFFEENTLMDQKFVMDQSMDIKEYLSISSEKIGTKILVKEFIRYEVGK